MPKWTLADGTELNYEIYGQGSGKPCLLLLPGLLGSIASQWPPFAQSLSDQFQVLLVDLRGHGRSTNSADSLEPGRMMQDVADFLDGMGVTAVHVAGYSLGGYLGLMLALNQPRRVQTLLLHATKFYWSADAVDQMQRQLNPETMAAKVPKYAEQLAQEHGGRHWRTLVRQAAALVGELGQSGLTEKVLGGVACPVLVSVGERDSLVPIREALRVARMLPQGELLVLPGVRHPFQTVRPVPLLPMMASFHRSR